MAKSCDEKKAAKGGQRENYFKDEDDRQKQNPGNRLSLAEPSLASRLPTPCANTNDCMTYARSPCCVCMLFSLPYHKVRSVEEAIQIQLSGKERSPYAEDCSLYEC